MAGDFKLLIFDWDGTLMDSEAQIVACMQAAITDLALEARTSAQIRNIIGLGLREAVHALYPDAADDLHLHMVKRYRHHFLAPTRSKAPLFEGAERVLHAMHAQGYLLAVATGKGRQGLDRVLAETGLGALFAATRCADETRSKPDPQMLLELLEELDVDAERALMIGDTEYDLEMAGHAGVGALAVTYGVHERERLSRHRPLGFLNAIADLPQWLAGAPEPATDAAG